MRLPSEQPGLELALREFDLWVTPSLGEIRDKDRFKEELSAVARVFDQLEAATGGFESQGSIDPTSIADTILDACQNAPESAGDLLNGLASVLFLVTGRSDNNAKCQLPLYLRDQSRWSSFPKVTTLKGRVRIANSDIPRILNSDRFMSTVLDVASDRNLQRRLLEEFISFILGDQKDVDQLWSVGHSYSVLKQFGRERDLLTPLVVFQVRGSVSASGGHEPEEILREQMTTWGLCAGIDFNTADVVLARHLNSLQVDGNSKTRAYDFLLPYKVTGWRSRLFVQCQYYAGDSGSVSHKNVDQTRASRDAVKQVVAEALFVEYVDGAGYFASLNGDLRRLLQMEDTFSFFQIRSAPIRLRRAIQSFGYCLPLEPAQIAVSADVGADTIGEQLKKQGYRKPEVRRALRDALSSGHLVERKKGTIEVSEEWRDTVRRLLLLDVAACHGSSLEPKRMGGALLVPGYGPFFGIKLDDLAREASIIAPALESRDWAGPAVFLEDIRWLCEKGYAMSV